MTDSLVSGKGVTLCVVLITRLHTEAYCLVFYTFLRTNTALWEVRDDELHFNWCCVCVDFSDSQRNGFLKAVEMLWKSVCRAPFTAAVKKRIEQLLKGCKFHYLQSVTNVSKNGSIVAPSMAGLFKSLANQMYDADTMPEFESAVSDMRHRFPKSRTWVNWWTQPGNYMLRLICHTSPVASHTSQVIAS